MGHVCEMSIGGVPVEGDKPLCLVIIQSTGIKRCQLFVKTYIFLVVVQKAKMFCKKIKFGLRFVQVSLFQ